jgi:hypothetical protein
MSAREINKNAPENSGAFLFLKKKSDYIFFLEVSLAIAFLEVSFLEVSFLEVSVAIFIEVSAFLEVSESALPDPPLPLQAAKDTAIAKANTPNLKEFFMLIFLSD